MFLKIANLRQLESTTHITFPNITSNNNLNPENKAARLKAKKKRVCMEKIHMRNHKIPRVGIQTFLSVVFKKMIYINYTCTQFILFCI